MWAIKHLITQLAVQELLALLNNTLKLNLPKDARTLKNTPKNISITKYDDNGQYWHNGVEVCLKKCFEGMDGDEIQQEIEININIDGLPMYNSSKFEFWPILMNIYGMGNQWSKFCEELKNILENGIQIKQREVKVRVRCFICDSPARAFVKGVANFNGQYGCLKCTTLGEFSSISKCNVFPRFHIQRRTDESFRNRSDKKHHKYDSLIEDLPIDMVEDFPVSDILHLIYLGIMKKQLGGWKTGVFRTINFKWSSRDILAINSLLENFKLPKEIHRKVRGLDCTAYWKGTEYVTFFHYVSIVLLKEFLPNEMYQHFLKLYCAITICCSDTYKPYLHAAKAMLEGYLEDFISIYGKDYVTSNVHNLCHLVDEVERFGNLLTFSAYPFESQLNQIKRLIKTGNNPLQQAAYRLTELSHLSNCHKNHQPYPNLGKEMYQTVEELLPDFTNSYRNVELADGFMLQNDDRNKWFLTKSDEIVVVKYITSTPQNNVLLWGSSFKKLENYFETPVQSSRLHIFISDCEENELKSYSITAVKCKMVAVKDKSKTVFIPLTHTLDLWA